MNRLLDLLDEGITGHAFPGAAFAVGDERRTWLGFRGSHTYDSLSSAVDDRTLWDLASLTKVMATTPAAMLLAQDGLIELDCPVNAALPELQADKDGVTFRMLLNHSSGWPAYADVTGFGLEEAWAHICRLPPATAPGVAHVYSCLGYVVLWRALSKVAGEPLDEWLAKRLYRPLNMDHTGFNPSEVDRSSCAPTAALPPWQRKLEDLRGFRRVQEDYVQGDVHDPIACVLGGVSGNAGLFATAEDVARFLRHCAGFDHGPLSPERVRAWAHDHGPSSDHGLGWVAKSLTGSSAGRRFSPSSFGHLGYTGTSVWIDPENGLFAALLTNRVHPDDRREGIAAFRPRFHDAVFEALRSPAA